jgi:hypothetical protein
VDKHGPVSFFLLAGRGGAGHGLSALVLLRAAGVLRKFAVHAQKSRAIYAIVGFNLLLFLLQAVVLLIFAVQLNGMAAKVVCLLALALTTLREYFLVLYPTKPEQRLFYTESCVFSSWGLLHPHRRDGSRLVRCDFVWSAAFKYRGPRRIPRFRRSGGAQSGLQRLGSGVGFAAIALLLFCRHRRVYLESSSDYTSCFRSRAGGISRYPDDSRFS